MVVLTLWLLMVVLTLWPEDSKASSLATQFSAPGDFVIGGLFAFHSEVQYPDQNAKPEIPKCHSFFPLGYLRHLAMRFAIAEINNSTSLLPGVVLGYEIHNTCNNIVVATKPTISFLAENTSDDDIRVQCDYTNFRPRIVAVVGPAASELSVVITQLLKFQSIPVISFASSSVNLSDRKLHPNFFRTIPSDFKQVDAMIQILGKFQWNWVAGLATDDEYGRRALELFVQLALTQDMCVAYEAILPNPEEGEKEDKLWSITAQLQTSQINAIVVFVHATAAEELLRAAIQKGLTGKVWIASECWATSPNIALIPNLFHVGTIIGVAVKSGKMPGFLEYVRHILADSNNQKQAFVNDEEEECPECRDLTLANFSTTLFRPSFHTSFNTYKAVYAIAHALHRLLRCDAITQKCNKDGEVFSRQVLEETARVNFTMESEQFYFNKMGNPPTGYDLVFWDWPTPNKSELVFIGGYDTLQDKLYISESKIHWRTKNQEPPVSRCTQACKPGQKQWLRGEYNCCYLCEDCPADSFQDPKNPSTCTPCKAHQWSPQQSTSCQERVLDYLQVTDLLSVIIVVLTALVLVQMAVITTILAKHWDTPAMRYMGSTATFLMVLSLTCFCASFILFVIKPAAWVCKLRQPLFFISFTVVLATLLGKAVQSAGLLWVLPRPWLRRNIIAVSVLLNTALQTILCIFWFQYNPPSLEENTDQQRIILLQCQDRQFPGFGALLTYDYSLAIICYICSCVGHNSGHENTTKSISFAMILVLIIWLLFVPAYATSQGKFVATFQVFAGLASTFAIHGSFYYPICYILLFAPHKNTDTHFRTPSQDSPEPPVNRENK